jgi:hypothetical protein
LASSFAQTTTIQKQVFPHDLHTQTCTPQNEETVLQDLFSNSVMQKNTCKNKLQTFWGWEIVSLRMWQTSKMKSVWTDRQRWMANVFHRTTNTRHKHSELAFAPVAAISQKINATSKQNTSKNKQLTSRDLGQQTRGDTCECTYSG